MHCLADTCLRAKNLLRSFDNVHGSDPYGNPVDEFPDEVLDSIKRNGVSSSSSALKPRDSDSREEYPAQCLSLLVS